MNTVRQDSRIGTANTAYARFLKAKEALLIRPYAPISKMCQLTLRYLKDYVNGIEYTSEYELVFMEYPLFFPYVFSINPQGNRGTYRETCADAIIRYRAPKSTDHTTPVASRVGVVEFKSIYGENSTRSELPIKKHVVQTLLQGFMLQQNTGVKVDR
jgi:hypothetical protein